MIWMIQNWRALGELQSCTEESILLNSRSTTMFYQKLHAHDDAVTPTTAWLQGGYMVTPNALPTHRYKASSTHSVQVRNNIISMLDLWTQTQQCTIIILLIELQCGFIKVGASSACGTNAHIWRKIRLNHSIREQSERADEHLVCLGDVLRELSFCPNHTFNTTN